MGNMFEKHVIMDTAKVIHLVSNAPEHPENTSNSFKVSYNVPFDLTGKQVALIDATVTKARGNVDDEKLTITFTSGSTKEIAAKIEGPLVSPTFRDAPFIKNFFTAYNKVIEHNQQKLLTIKYNIPVDSTVYMIEFEIENHGKYSGEISAVTFTRNSWVYRRGSIIEHDETRKALPLIAPIQHRSSEAKKFTFVIRPKEKLLMNMQLNPEIFDIIESPEGYERFKSDVALTVKTKCAIESALVVEPGQGYYQNIQSLINQFNRHNEFKKIAKIALVNSKIHFTVLPTSVPIATMDFGGLESHFRFNDRIISGPITSKTVLIAQKPPDLLHGTHHFYIYCSLVKNNPVNNRLLQILATVDATKGVYGEQVVHHVQYPMFIDCVEGPQQMVEVTIADDTGSIQGLLMGRTKLTLAVKDA